MRVYQIAMLSNIALLASELGRTTGAIGVGIGGSRALGLNRCDSDWDLVLIFEQERTVPPTELRRVLQPFCDPGSLQILGRYLTGACRGEKIEIFQKSTPTIRTELERARRGEFGWKVAPLFAHGDLSTRLLSHIQMMKIAWQRNNELSKLQESLLPFPQELRKSLSEYFCTRAAECLFHLRKLRAEPRMFEAISCFSAFVAYTSIAIYAVNCLYPVLEKGRDAILQTLSTKPGDYSSRLLRSFELIQTNDMSSAIEILDRVLSELKGIMATMNRANA